MSLLSNSPLKGKEDQPAPASVTTDSSGSQLHASTAGDDNDDDNNLEKDVTAAEMALLLQDARGLLEDEDTSTEDEDTEDKKDK